MGLTQPGGYYLDASGNAVDANGNPAKKDEKALKAAAEAMEAAAPKEAPPQQVVVIPAGSVAAPAKRKK